MTELLKISLPDGSVREMPAGSTPGDVAAAIGPGLAKAALAARVDGEVRDINRPFDGDAELARLRFIRRAQTLGFSLDEISDLLALDHEIDRENARALARSKIASVKERIRQLEHVRSALQELVDCCEHTASPAPCPILRALGDEPG